MSDEKKAGEEKKVQRREEERIRSLEKGVPPEKGKHDGSRGKQNPHSPEKLHTPEQGGAGLKVSAEQSRPAPDHALEDFGALVSHRANHGLLGRFPGGAATSPGGSKASAVEAENGQPGDDRYRDMFLPSDQFVHEMRAARLVALGLKGRRFG